MRVINKKTVSGILTVIIVLSVFFAVHFVIHYTNAFRVEAVDMNNSALKSYQDQIAAVEAERKEYKRALEEAKNSQATAMIEKVQLDNLVITMQKKIDLQIEMIDEINSQIEETKLNIEETQKSIDERQEIFKERLIATYEEGNINYLEIILGAESLADFFTRIDNVITIFEYDKSLIKQYESDKAQLEEYKISLAVREAEYQNALEEYQISLREAEANQQESELYIQKLKADEERYAEAESAAAEKSYELNLQLEERIRQIEEQERKDREAREAEEKRIAEEKRLAEIEAQRLKDEAEAAAKREAAAKEEAEYLASIAKAAEEKAAAEKAKADAEKAERAAKTAEMAAKIAQENVEEQLTKLNDVISQKAPAANSNYIWPLDKSNSRISSVFGPREYNGVNENHGAIDIPGAYGASIYASNSGKVALAEYHYSYGNYVVIDHGNGIFTLYAHMSSMLVVASDKVVQGDVIGKVGSTGYSDGNHLHFEVRDNGVRVDPLLYVTQP